eukprot:CAMPEP_0117501536 /NCGR_PEP_ID=MMETSP0784-20121206/23349_1 /TAXON_ID=39447 /ORGANISM="" /LENGTH=758 /DNA_ID=CAMNT_0005296793 /DNA_START=62 /DNA_END=2338 /DNA_ORIENTATION=-
MQLATAMPALLVSFFALSCARGRAAGTTAVYVGARAASTAGPLAKVVTLLAEMKAQVEKQAAQDDVSHHKYECWCDTNTKAKDAAVEAAEAKISELEAFVEEAVGTQGKLKTEIGALISSIAEDKDALEKATAIRVKEAAEFTSEATDTKECIDTLGEAIAVLSKVQLLQRGGRSLRSAQIKPLLLQLQAKLRDARKLDLQDVLQQHKHLDVHFRSVMQQDIWDVMGALDVARVSPGPASSGRKTLSALARSAGQLGVDAMAGAVAAPMEGAAAGAVSYNFRSGQIVGVLSQLKKDFENSLSSSEKAEMEAAAAYSQLKAAKEAEIAAEAAQQAAKEKALADLASKVANTKDDMAATRNALSADQQFLLDLSKSCTSAKEEYASRSKVRAEEIQALGEAIAILREDDARDLFGKTLSLLQTGAGAERATRARAVQVAVANKAINAATQHIMRVARKQKNWSLASLALRLRLDPFEKVKEVMDKMLGELKAQQKSETAKLEFCKKELDETEDSVKVKLSEKADLEATNTNLEDSISTLEGDLETLAAVVAETKVSLKQAGEDRQTENAHFQQAVSDQRATIAILKKALARLQQFYVPKALVQVAAARQTPGMAVAPPPPAAKEYQKNGGAGGVMQLMQKIITDAESEEAEMIVEEQHSQDSYTRLVKDTNEMLNAHQASISEKTKLKEATAGEKSLTEAALLTNADELSNLQDLLKNVHLDCDWLMKYFDVRKTARAEEIDAIEEAKAILSGADFGTAF